MTRAASGLIVARTTSRNGASPVGKQRTVEELAPIVRLYDSAAQQAVIGQLGSKLGLPEGVIREWVGRARASTRDHLPADRPAAARWQGSKVLRELFWLLIHHNDLVVEEIKERTGFTNVKTFPHGSPGKLFSLQ